MGFDRVTTKMLEYLVIKHGHLIGKEDIHTKDGAMLLLAIMTQ